MKQEPRRVGALVTSVLLASLVSTTSHALQSTPHAPSRPWSLDWTALAPMPGAGPAVAQIVETNADHDRLYAATSAGLITSADRGLHWTLRARYPRAVWSTASVAVSSIDADALLLCPWGDGIWRSGDGGLTWSRPDLAPGDPWLFGVVFAPSCTSTVYVTSSDGVWRSLDAGASFVPVLSGIAALGGIGWTTVVDPQDALHVYFQAWNVGVFETHDAGATWQQHAFPPGNAGGLSMAIDPNDGQRLLLGDNAVIWLSTDGAATWSNASAGLGAYYVDGLAIDPADPHRFYAARRMGGLAISTDGGASWTGVADPGLDRAGGSPLALLPSRFDANLLLVGDAGGVFRSIDRGAHFQRQNDGLAACAQVRDVVVDPFDSTRLVAKTGGSIYASIDSGASWTEAGGLSLAFGYGLAADRGIPGRFYASSWNHTLWRSDDGGATFQALSGGPVGFTRLVAHPTAGGRLFATGNGLWRSDDGGASFTALPVPASWTWSFAISPADPALMYCNSDTLVFRSQDGGASWLVADVSPAGIVREIVADPVVADRAFAATPFVGLFVSEDRGRTWLPAAPQLVDADTVAVSPLLPRVLFANDIGTSTVRASRDRGATAWELGFGLATSVSRFAITSRALYASTEGSGVMVLR